MTQADADAMRASDELGEWMRANPKARIPRWAWKALWTGHGRRILEWLEARVERV